MKPCSKNRKLLAWLALGNLDAEQATALREHLVTCPGCRRYLDELSSVAATLNAAEIMTDIEATASFHQRVIAGIKAEEPPFARPGIEKFFRGTLLNWRVALPTVGAVAVVLVVGLLLTSRQQPEVPLPAPSSAQSGSDHNLDGDFRPTIANYQMIANQSLEKLDQLLTAQGSRKLPPAPIYTASAFATAGVSE
jgi:anti-sigma factor RsiW